MASDRLPVVASTDPPTATIQAAYSKRKRQDKQVLHEALVTRLRAWLERKKPSRDELLFPVSGKVPGGIERKTAKMMKLDLAAARSNWLEEFESDAERSRHDESDFLRYCDHDGRFADFHSNRHTFITSLSRNAVSPRMAQSLARHSDIRLTMGTYTHVEVNDQQAAIESLPAPPAYSSGTRQRSTRAGRKASDDDSEPSEMVPKMVPSGAENGAIHLAAEKYQPSSDCIENATERVQKRQKPADVSSQRALKLRTAEDTSEEAQTDCHNVISEVHPARFELATSGFVNRGNDSIKPGSDAGSSEAIGDLPQCLPQQPEIDVETAPHSGAEPSLNAALAMIERLPLSDAEKADAIRQLLAAQRSRS